MDASQRRLPTLVIRNIPDQIDGFKFEDFEIVDYVASAAYRRANCGLTVMVMIQMTAVVAMAENRVIGDGKGLIWHIA